jgi:hypothetical protein
MFDRIRVACAWVAERARHVRIAPDLETYARGLDVAAVQAPRYDTEHHYLGEPDARAAYVVVLDAVNFGSGFFPALRSVDGRRGYHAVAWSLKRWFEDEGVPDTRVLRSLDAAAMATLLAQDLDDPLRAEAMRLYAEALAELGAFLDARMGGSAVALVRSAGGSAERLAALLAEMPFYRDVWRYDEREVPLYKRAQITASDLALAFGGAGYGAFDDLDRLTVFADDLVPHVLRTDGVLEYDAPLARRIADGEPLLAGSPEEVEVRAVTVHAAERITSALREDGVAVTPRDLDIALWNRGQDPRYAAVPRHRTITTAY